MEKKVCICLINWNRAQELTIECIESLLKLDYKNAQIFVFDNDSTDGSVQKIIDYCERKLQPHIPESDLLKQYVVPVGTSPISYEVLSEQEFDSYDLSKQHHATVTIIKNTKNYGFGHANNQMFTALAKSNTDGYVWVLNNDTIVKPDTLTALAQKMESDKKIGIVGSVMVYYDSPETIQCAGGVRFFPLFGFGPMHMRNKPVSILTTTAESDVESEITYAPGTSILVSKSLIQDIGGFSKDYFMYAEDADFFLRAKRAGWKFGIALKSIVYHKEGRSTAGKKHTFFFMYTQSNILLLRKFYGLFFALTAIPASMLHTMKMTPSFKNVWFTLKGALSGLSKRYSKNEVIA